MAGSALGRTPDPDQSPSHQFPPRGGDATDGGSMSKSPNARVRNQIGAATAEYAAVTAAGCGLAGLLIKLLTGDFGQTLLKMIFDLVKAFIGL